jgi:hypothetical protein
MQKRKGLTQRQIKKATEMFKNPKLNTLSDFQNSASKKIPESTFFVYPRDPKLSYT